MEKQEYASIPELHERISPETALFSIASRATRPRTEFPAFRLYGFFSRPQDAQAASDELQQSTGQQFTTTLGPTSTFLLMWEDEDIAADERAEAVTQRKCAYRTYLEHRDKQFDQRLRDLQESKSEHIRKHAVHYQSELPPLPPSPFLLQPPTVSKSLFEPGLPSAEQHLGSTFFHNPRTDTQLKHVPESLQQPDQKVAVISILPDLITGHFPQAPNAEELNDAADPDRARLIWNQQSIGRMPLVAFVAAFPKTKMATKYAQELGHVFPWYRFVVVEMYRWVIPALLFRDYWKIPKIYLNPQKQAVLGTYQKQFLEHEHEIAQQPPLEMERTLDREGNPLPGTELYYLRRGEVELAAEARKMEELRRKTKVFETDFKECSKDPEPLRNSTTMAYLVRALLSDFRSIWEAEGRKYDYESVQAIRDRLCRENEEYRRMATVTHPRVFRRITNPQLCQEELDAIYYMLRIRQQVERGEISESNASQMLGSAHHSFSMSGEVSKQDERDLATPRQ